MSFKWVRVMEMEAIYLYQICLELPNLSHPLKYLTLNSVKLHQNIFGKNFENSLMKVSELQQRGNVEIYDLYLL